jgi:hypothetical protein
MNVYKKGGELSSRFDHVFAGADALSSTETIDIYV